MNPYGPWSWGSSRQVKKARSPEEEEYRARVTANKKKASDQARRRRETAMARAIREVNQLPIDHSERRLWADGVADKLKRVERDAARDYEQQLHASYDKDQAGKRRAMAMGKATPVWANATEMLRIYKRARQMTEELGVEFAVDHIVPIQSKWVCGLNWEGNLEIVRTRFNLKKGNRTWPDMPDNFSGLGQGLAKKS